MIRKINVDIAMFKYFMEMIRKGKSIRCANVIMYIHSVFHLYDTKWKYDVFQMLNLVLLEKLVTCNCFED